MSFKLGNVMDKYGVSYTKLAKLCNRSVTSIRSDAYTTGVRNKFTAMAYAYALNCDVNDILEKTEPEKIEGWEQPCLPGCEL
jgi:DNA-binding Xre family transcriptional regulator